MAKKEDPQRTALNRDRELDEPGSGLTDHEKVRLSAPLTAGAERALLPRCARWG